MSEGPLHRIQVVRTVPLIINQYKLVPVSSGDALSLEGNHMSICGWVND